MVGESQEQLVGAGAGGASGSNKTPTLEEYGTNLTNQANEVSLSVTLWCIVEGFLDEQLLRHKRQ